MKRNILILFTGFVLTSIAANSQTVTGTELKVTHTTLGDNGDAIRFYRADTNSDYGRLRLALGDEEYADFEIGNNYYQGGEWRPAFSLDGNGNSWLKGSMGLGVGAYSLSKIHAKSPAVTEWGVMVEASPNRRVIGLGHDGTNGIISVGVMDGAAGFSPLEFRTSNLSRMLIGTNGNIGIGTATPSQKVEVNGNMLQNAENAAFGIDAQQTARFGFIKRFGDYTTIASDALSPITFSQTNQTGIFTNITGATITERMRIHTNGNVGIGTKNPDQKLTVKGKIHAEEIIIDTSVPVPDYVFEQNYPLTSLNEVQAYIAQHKHLPEVPSAKEMEKEGVKVGEMEMILLKKIEEITLHLIEMKNINDQQSQQMKKMQVELDVLRNK